MIGAQKQPRLGPRGQGGAELDAEGPKMAVLLLWEFPKRWAREFPQRRSRGQAGAKEDEAAPTMTVWL